MATGVLQAWSTTASSNGSADSAINAAEGSSFKMPAINDMGRGIMAGVKAFANQITGAKTSGGSSNAYTFTSDTQAAITSLAAGRALVFKANHTNTGASTLNVDGIGATAIRKGGAETALAANDIVSGGMYFVAYNGTYWILLNPELTTSSVGYQPLDATLTALAALSWSSGNALVQFTAADTVSLTLAPSVSSITVSQGAAQATASLTAINTTDHASVRAARFEGDRATPAANDAVYVSYFLSDSAGNQDEFARIQVLGETVSSGSEAGQLRFWVVTSGALAAKLTLSSSILAPLSDGGLQLGAGTLGYGGLNLSSGAAINFNNGDVTLTHSSNALEVAGGGFAAPLLASSETSGTLTAASRNRKVNCAGGVTLDDGVFAAEDWQVFDAGAANRTFTRAAGLTMYVNGTDSATATLPANTQGGAVWRSATVVVLSGAFY